jgi:hypothetical protein
VLGGCSDRVGQGEDSGFKPLLMIFISSVSFGLFSHPQFLLARAAAPPPGKLAEELSGRACSALLPAALKPLVREASVAPTAENPPTTAESRMIELTSCAQVPTARLVLYPVPPQARLSVSLPSPIRVSMR